MSDRLLTIEQAAEWFQTTPNALHMQRYRGLYPGALGVKVGKRILWRQSDLEQWFEEQQAAHLEQVAG